MHAISGQHEKLEHLLPSDPSHAIGSQRPGVLLLNVTFLSPLSAVPRVSLLGLGTFVIWATSQVGLLKQQRLDSHICVNNEAGYGYKCSFALNDPSQ